MSDFLSPILQWINEHPEMAGIATFLISAAESVAIIGTIVPGTVMMTAIGTLAGSGVMPLWSTIMWAILGAIVGDGISYWLGFHFKDRLHYVWPFKKYPNVLATGEKFFIKHGGKSVFIGRFVGPVRALVPLVAGMFGMKPWRFFIANIISAIGWAPAYMLPGIALGAASLELPPDIAVHAILMLLLVGLFTILCIWVIQKLFKLISTQINQGLTTFWMHLQDSRYFSPIASALKHYDPSKTYGQLTLGFYFLVTLVFFLYFALYIKAHGSQDILINNAFLHLFRSLRTPLGDTFMLFITFLGESKILSVVMLILVIWFIAKKNWRTAYHVFALGILLSVSIEAFKHFVHSPRPWGIVHPPKGYSFPSGHATFSIAFYAGLALLLTKVFKQKYRSVFYIIAGLIIVAICTSRLYLGAHWFTDVLGGLLLGAAILILVVLSYNRKKEQFIYARGLLITFLITLFVTYGVYGLTFYKTFKHNYQQSEWPTYTLSLNEWWNQKNDHLPLYRLNRFGFSSQILNLQWTGDISKIRNLLLSNGWGIPSNVDWITVLHRVSDVQSAEHLPLVSPLYMDKNPALVLVKSTSNHKLIVLRLWDSNIEFKDWHEPLWVGTVEIAPRTYSWLFKDKWANDIKLSPSLLFSSLPPDYDIGQTIVTNTHKRNSEQQTIVLIKPKK